ncbi:hypothetical protein INT47_001506 [Mucor saturninus]|uniref:Uncharacterized protein n=1 Tax=Mucor saturninus TaxID=64648 RepID=A0A8H7V0Z9_9FUNG|nr:hypothetical protein INT47_001506 [Mucor saturninus]
MDSASLTKGINAWPVSSIPKSKGTEISPNDTSPKKPLSRYDTVWPTSRDISRRHSFDRSRRHSNFDREPDFHSYYKDSVSREPVNVSVIPRESPHDTSHPHQTKRHLNRGSASPSFFDTTTLPDKETTTMYHSSYAFESESKKIPCEPSDLKERRDYQENRRIPSNRTPNYSTLNVPFTSALATHETDGRDSLLMLRTSHDTLPLLDQQPYTYSSSEFRNPYASRVHERKFEITPMRKEKHPSALTSDTQKLFGGDISPTTDAASLINAQIPKRPQPSTSVSPTFPVPVAKRGFNPDICQVSRDGLFETNTARLASPKKPTNCRNSQPSAPSYPDSNAEIYTPQILWNNPKIKRISTPNLPSYNFNQEIAIPKTRRRASVTQVTPNHPIMIDQEKPAPQIPKAKKKSTKSRAKKVLTNLYHNNGFLKYSIYYELDSDGEKSYYYQPFFSKKIYCTVTSEHEVRLR